MTTKPYLELLKLRARVDVLEGALRRISHGCRLPDSVAAEASLRHSPHFTTAVLDALAGLARWCSSDGFHNYCGRNWCDVCGGELLHVEIFEQQMREQDARAELAEVERERDTMRAERDASSRAHEQAEALLVAAERRLAACADWLGRYKAACEQQGMGFDFRVGEALRAAEAPKKEAQPPWATCDHYGPCDCTGPDYTPANFSGALAGSPAPSVEPASVGGNDGSLQVFKKSGTGSRLKTDTEMAAGFGDVPEHDYRDAVNDAKHLLAHHTSPLGNNAIARNMAAALVALDVHAYGPAGYRAERDELRRKLAEVGRKILELQMREQEQEHKWECYDDVVAERDEALRKLAEVERERDAEATMRVEANAREQAAHAIIGYDTPPQGGTVPVRVQALKDRAEAAERRAAQAERERDDFAAKAARFIDEEGKRIDAERKLAAAVEALRKADEKLAGFGYSAGWGARVTLGEALRAAETPEDSNAGGGEQQSHVQRDGAAAPHASAGPDRLAKPESDSPASDVAPAPAEEAAQAPADVFAEADDAMRRVARENAAHEEPIPLQVGDVICPACVHVFRAQQPHGCKVAEPLEPAAVRDESVPPVDILAARDAIDRAIYVAQNEPHHIAVETLRAGIQQARKHLPLHSVHGYAPAAPRLDRFRALAEWWSVINGNDPYALATRDCAEELLAVVEEVERG